MNKPKVGDLLWSVPVGNAARRGNTEPEQVEVMKVGRKYFYTEVVSETYRRKDTFLVSNWKQNTDYTPTAELYEDLQGYLDNTETKKIRSEIQSAFTAWGPCKYTLDQLQRIKSIIEEVN